MTGRHGGTAVAAAWMAGAIAAFSLLAVAGREVSPEFDTFEIMLWRSGFGLLVVTALMVARGRLADARPRRLAVHGARNLIHFAGQNLWFHALAVLPLAQVFALEFTSPLWVLLLAPLLLGERLTRRGLLAGAVGFLGVLLVARPGVVAISPGLLAAALCAVCFALTSIVTKRLTRTEPVTAILFWLCLIQLGLSLLVTARDGVVPVPGPDLLPWFGVIGIAGLAAHWCLTSALSAAPASVVMPLDFLRLPVIAVVGWAAYGEALDPLLFLGAGLILAGNLLTLRPSS
ncbi:DMT family transporter [Rubellimicrobium aerolatum]|uniref:DMT family transporter n=1 Tax=Rubellimicrobium aerolatum TaxID=490979 RepID=A0ABW0S881_9RHOB|nr:DMT family transporter [Rubellimicrobium aerolatum]MBP1804334.1 drug/metabolite transporter (DMT)-like permease [Rubellimicrobium aerolatum]